MKRLAIAFALALLAGCGEGHLADTEETSAISQGIVGGTVDNGHDAVVAMFNYDIGSICSGTMVSDRVYLTAAHCITSMDPYDYQVVGGTNVNTQDVDWFEDIDDVAIHPSYDDTNNLHDVGVLVLQQDAPVDSYRWLADDDDGIYDEGTEFTLVGYGITSGSGDNSGVKRKVDLEITEIYSDLIVYGNSQRNGCSGDSGGPALVSIGGKMTVIAITSFGDVNCSQFGASMRTDDNETFIDNFAEPNEGDGGPGGGGGGGGNDKGPFGCSVASAIGPASGNLAPALLALAAIAVSSRRRRT